MSFGSLKNNVTAELFVYKLSVCKQDLSSNNLQKVDMS